MDDPAENEPGVLVSRLKGAYRTIRRLADDRQQSATVPLERLSQIPANAGTGMMTEFNATRFHFETGMTPEEYVLLFLDAHEGRCRQQALVQSLEWSDATVCRLLTEMERDGAVRRIKTGRENIVCYPDVTFG